MGYAPVRLTFLRLKSALVCFIHSANSFNEYFRQWARDWEYSYQVDKVPAFHAPAADRGDQQQTGHYSKVPGEVQINAAA